MWPLQRTTAPTPQTDPQPTSETFTHFTRRWECEPPTNRTAYPYTWRVTACEWTTEGRRQIQTITEWEAITKLRGATWPTTSTQPATSHKSSNA